VDIHETLSTKPSRNPGAARCNLRQAHLEASPSTSAAARVPGSSYVRVTRVRRGFLDFRINLASNEDSRAREIQPQQKRNHRLHFCIGPL
jgi:hypothetical protein